LTLPSDSPTVGLSIACTEPTREVIIARLQGLEFEAFLELDDSVVAYCPADQWTESLQEAVRGILSDLRIEVVPSVEIVAPQNWNRRWEESVRPVEAGNFLITPSWHRKSVSETDRVIIEIDPKMSFGTGYHETTRLVLRLLTNEVRAGDIVLDAGTGTGILAIAAARLGATKVIGFDIDPWSERNAKENCLRNRVDAVVEIRLGDLDAVSEQPFDVILANIQLDVIQRMLPGLEEKLAADGRLIVSGILLTQQRALIDAAKGFGLGVTSEESEGEWWASVLQRA